MEWLAAVRMVAGDDEAQSRRSFYLLSGGLKEHRRSTAERLLSISFICIYGGQRWNGHEGTDDPGQLFDSSGKLG